MFGHIASDTKFLNFCTVLSDKKVENSDNNVTNLTMINNLFISLNDVIVINVLKDKDRSFHHLNS